MPLPHDALVLVADGRKMLFFRNHGDENQIDLRTEAHDARKDRKDREIKTDAPGGIQQSFGYGHSTYEETDFQQQEEDRWIKDAAEELKKRGPARRFRGARHRRSAQGARRPEKMPPQGGREEDRLHRQQGNERPSDPRYRGAADGRDAGGHSGELARRLGPAVYTIGHSTRAIPEFVELLRAGPVQLVIDVRTVPRSRTNPQYNADALAGHARRLADRLRPDRWARRASRPLP